MKEQQLFLLSGLAGLACNVALFLSAMLFQRWFLAPLLVGWLAAIPLVFCLSLSVAEIPIMVVGLRKLAVDPKRKSFALLAFTNALYVCFAAVYAGLFVLLTGKVLIGAGLSALGIVRLLSSLIFVNQQRSS